MKTQNNWFFYKSFNYTFQMALCLATSFSSTISICGSSIVCEGCCSKLLIIIHLLPCLNMIFDITTRECTKIHHTIHGAWNPNLKPLWILKTPKNISFSWWTWLQWPPRQQEKPITMKPTTKQPKWLQYSFQHVLFANTNWITCGMPIWNNTQKITLQNL